MPTNADMEKKADTVSRIMGTQLLVNATASGVETFDFGKAAADASRLLSASEALKEKGLLVDPEMYERLLTLRQDRQLKKMFGGWFLFLTAFFTVAAYAIVVLDGALKWSIPTTAITALIIEIPIQFVGLLYIIARHFFPQNPTGVVKEDDNDM